METLVKLLAVAGGAAIGATSVGLVVRIFGRLLGVHSRPKRALVVLRALGALTAGWLVWLLVFGLGGGGLGGPGGLGKGGGHADIPNTTGRAGALSTPQAETREPAKSLSIVMLGGARVQDSRFYLLVGDNIAYSLPELKNHILARRSEGLRAIEILIYDNSVATDHAAVRSLEQWAGENDLTITWSRVAGELPS
jgi:hypothetical protein